MSLGTLKTKVLLDQPDEIYHGSLEPVQGHVEMQYYPPRKSAKSQAGKSSPLNVSVTLRGRITIKCKPFPTAGAVPGRAPLFFRKFGLHDSQISFKSQQPVSFAFSLYFPPGTDNANQLQRWRRDPRFERRPGAALPPSMTTKKFYECCIEYLVQAVVQMPGADIDIVSDDAFKLQEGTPVLYEPISMRNHPIASTPIERSIATVVAAPATSDKKKSLFSKRKSPAPPSTEPNFFTAITTQAPRYLRLGEHVSLTFHLTTDNSIPPAFPTLLFPQHTLTAFALILKATTTVRLDRKTKRRHHPEVTETILAVEPKMALEPASGMFGTRDGATVLVRTKDLLLGLVPSFKTINVSRSYVLKLAFQVEVAGQSCRVMRECDVVILPPRSIDGDLMKSTEARGAEWTTAENMMAVGALGDGVSGLVEAVDDEEQGDQDEGEDFDDDEELDIDGDVDEEGVLGLFDF